MLKSTNQAPKLKAKYKSTLVSTSVYYPQDKRRAALAKEAGASHGAWVEAYNPKPI